MIEKLTLTPGTMIGAYRITEHIGVGGFSEVWSGWDTHLNRLVAIKVMPRTGIDGHNTIQFGREAAMVTRLEHPHILPLYDFGENPEFRYLVMRYVTGGSLAQRIEKKRLPLGEILRLMQPIASTLDYIHEQRVVHRDIKPGNILLDAQNLPYLTDFGLAKQLTDETRPMHSASGTLTYMPPEQFSGGVLSVRSDLYSFGVLLFQLFTGELPYEGKVALGMRQLSTHEPLLDVTLVNPKLPERLNEYLRSLTDPDPAARPDSAVEVMNNIAELIHGIDGGEPITVQGMTYALESSAYRRRETESLIEQNATAWESEVFALTLTHFVLMDMFLRDMPDLLTSPVRSLLLRGALEYGQHVDYWWQQCSDLERQKAVWHAIAHGTDDASQRALSMAKTTTWASSVNADLLNKIGKRLMPLSLYTGAALDFIEQALPVRENWYEDSTFMDLDTNLAALAAGRSSLAMQAARVIGRFRRTLAMMALPNTVSQAAPVLTAYETAGSLPKSLARVTQFRLSLLLAFRQLIRQPLQALGQYTWAALGCVISTAMMIYFTYRAADPANILSTGRLLNTLGLGLMYGLIYAIGVWIARHIGQRLKVAPYWLRTIIAIGVGGSIVCVGFTLFQQLVYEDIIDPWVSYASGMLFVAGFALSVEMPPVAQVIIGAAGVVGAYLIPFSSYITTYEIRPPFIFDEADPMMAIPLAIAAGLVLAIFTLGYIWRAFAEREVHRRRQHSTAHSAPGIPVAG